jgi:mRNA degradation ribonuclease J1/J2
VICLLFKFESQNNKIMKGQIIEFNWDRTGVVQLENGIVLHFGKSNLKAHQIFKSGDNIVANYSDGKIGTMVSAE